MWCNEDGVVLANTMLFCLYLNQEKGMLPPHATGLLVKNKNQKMSTKSPAKQISHDFKL